MTQYPKHFHDVKYGSENRLQTLDICLPRPLEASEAALNSLGSTKSYGLIWIV